MADAGDSFYNKKAVDGDMVTVNVGKGFPCK